MNTKLNLSPTSLVEENETLRKKLEELEKNIEGKEELRKKITWWISKFVSFIGCIYLLVTIFAPTDARINKISNTDIFMFAIIFLFNSGFIENLENLSVDGTKVEAKFQKIEAKQEQQKEEIDTLQQQQLNLQKKQLDILTIQQQEISQLQKEQNIALKLAVKAIIDQYEFKHLRELKRCEEENMPYIINHRFIKPFEQEIRHLYAVRFINKNSSISGLINKLNSIHQEDLTKYVSVTAEGRRYLELREKLDIDEPDDEEVQISVN